MNSVILTGLLAIVIMGSSGAAYAQYYSGNVGPDGETGKRTLEEALKLQRERVEIAQNNPGTGSGTPYISADGVVGASVITGAIFGGIAAAFFFKARSGKYAAMGRG